MCCRGAVLCVFVEVVGTAHCEIQAQLCGLQSLVSFYSAECRPRTWDSVQREHGTGKSDPSAVRNTLCDLIKSIRDCESVSKAGVFSSRDSAPAAPESVCECECVWCMILLSC